MNELPKGWETAEIGDLCNLINGRAFKSQEWAESGLPIIRIQNLNSQKSKFNYFSGDLDSKHLISNGDLLFAWSGTPGTSFGAHVWHGSDAALNQHIFKIEFSEECIERNFLRYAIDQKLDDIIGSAQGGVGLRHVTKGTFERTVIAFPPRAEQTRIAQKLDELLAQVDTLKARIDAIPALLKRFRQSVLAAAVSGRLTEEWRELNKPEKLDIEKIKTEQIALGITKGNFPTSKTKTSLEQDFEASVKHTNDWPTTRIGDICGCIVPNRDKPRSFTGKIHWVVTENIPEQSILINYKSITTGLTRGEAEESKAKIIPKNSVLMTCIGRLGLSALVEEECVINQQLHAFLENKLLNPRFLAFAIRANKKYFDTISTSTTISYLNKTACNSMPIGLPTQQEQLEIVRRVEQVFAFADQVEDRVAIAQAYIGKLTQSMLASAFRGELVPQDPNDEPASVLLARIQAQRAATPKAKRGRNSARNE